MPAILQIRRIVVQSHPGQTVLETLSRKHSTQNRAGRVVQVVKCLPSKCEPLSLNSSTKKNKNKSTNRYAMFMDKTISYY
jgi:hypothetical protein